MRGQRSVLEPARSKQPAATIGFERKGIGAGMAVDPTALVVRGRVGRLFPREVGNIEPGPTPGARIPPDIFFSLGPGLAGRVRGGAVIEDAPVARPGKAPFGVDVVPRRAVSATRQVLSGR